MRTNLKFFSAGLVLSALFSTFILDKLHQPYVKMSPRGYCHTIESPYYTQTFNFRPFSSLKDCLEAGGVEFRR